MLPLPRPNARSSGSKHPVPRGASEADRAVFKQRRKEEKKKRREEGKRVAAGVPPLPRMVNPALPPAAQEQEVRENDLASARCRSALERTVRRRVEVVVPRSSGKVGEKRKRSPTDDEEESEDENEEENEVDEVLGLNAVVPLVRGKFAFGRILYRYVFLLGFEVRLFG